VDIVNKKPRHCLPGFIYQLQLRVQEYPGNPVLFPTRRLLFVGFPSLVRSTSSPKYKDLINMFQQGLQSLKQCIKQ
jgi:hypothetical protein